MKKKSAANHLNVREYSLSQNIVYSLKNTRLCHPQLLLWCLFAVALNVALPVLSTFLPKVVIGIITSAGPAGNLIGATLAFMLGIALLSGLKRFVDKVVSSQKYRMNTYYTSKVADKGLTTDYCNQENERFRKLQSESFQACNTHGSAVAQVYDIGIALLADAIGFAVYFGLLTRLNPVVVLFLIATTAVSYLLNGKVIRWTADHNEEKIGFQQRTDYLNRVSGDIKSAKDIRLYNMSVWLEKVYRINANGLAGWYRRCASKVFGVSVGDSGLSLLREGVAYAYLISLVLGGKMTIADFVLYFGVITGFSVWLGDILAQVNALNRISLTLSTLRAYLEYPESYQREQGINPGLSYPKTIELRNVHYRYDGATADTLRDINLTIDPTEHLAVVGLNGAGKTTLIKLICGLVDPTEGTVLYDGVDVRQYNRKAYYQLFSAVFQQFSIMPVTLEEIVAEAASDTLRADRVEDCLRQAGLWEKVVSLPKGTKSEYGKAIHDDGVELSGGETQKLLLARALYRSSPVMILDEPTAALDPISESKLYGSYHDITRDRTAVFISHRLASTRFCDRILLLEDGAILEEGTHDRLLADKGRYAMLFETQAKYYREHPEEWEGKP